MGIDSAWLSPGMFRGFADIAFANGDPTDPWLIAFEAERRGTRQFSNWSLLPVDLWATCPMTRPAFGRYLDAGRGSGWLRAAQRRHWSRFRRQARGRTQRGLDGAAPCLSRALPAAWPGSCWGVGESLCQSDAGTGSRPGQRRARIRRRDADRMGTPLLEEPTTYWRRRSGQWL